MATTEERIARLEADLAALRQELQQARLIGIPNTTTLVHIDPGKGVPVVPTSPTPPPPRSVPSPRSA